MAIRRDVHRICDTCWDRIVGKPHWKVRDLHHFFVFNRNGACCYCDNPSHGQVWVAPRSEVPCQGLFGFHAEQSEIIDLTEIRARYQSDAEVMKLISMAEALHKELNGTTAISERKTS